MNCPKELVLFLILGGNVVLLITFCGLAEGAIQAVAKSLNDKTNKKTDMKNRTQPSRFRQTAVSGSGKVNLIVKAIHRWINKLFEKNSKPPLGRIFLNLKIKTL